MGECGAVDGDDALGIVHGAGADADGAGCTPAAWALNIVVNAVVVGVFAVAAWVVCRRHRQRLQRLHSLERMMDVD